MREAVPDVALIEAIRRGLVELANPAKAPDMQAYLKSLMPVHAVPTAARRRLVRTLVTAHPPAGVEVWRATVETLWRTAEYREERYAAIDLTGWSRATAWQTPRLLPLYDEMVATGAWWDLVDDVAIHRIGPLLRAYPDELTPVMRAWARDPDRWRRRSAVICQVGAKVATDLDLLTEAVERNAGDRDFFLRKAIGWALREYAKTDPEWVRRFVAAHDLSTLSMREATKHLGA